MQIFLFVNHASFNLTSQEVLFVLHCRNAHTSDHLQLHLSTLTQRFPC